MRRRIILESGVKTESVTINVTTSNGASASGITITINGSATTTNADGVAYGEVPFDTEYSIVFGEKTSYSTPATITRTASAETYTTAVTYTLLNERCTVTTNLATTITINGSTSSSNVKSYSVDVPYGTVYTVSIADKSNYNKPSNKTFTASTSSNNVTMNYTAKTGTWSVTITGLPGSFYSYVYVNGKQSGHTYNNPITGTSTYGTTIRVEPYGVGCGSSAWWPNYKCRYNCEFNQTINSPSVSQTIQYYQYPCLRCTGPANGYINVSLIRSNCSYNYSSYDYDNFNVYLDENGYGCYDVSRYIKPYYDECGDSRYWATDWIYAYKSDGSYSSRTIDGPVLSGDTFYKTVNLY